MSVDRIIQDITAHGLQSSARYTVAIGPFTIPSSYIISIDIPGPKYDILNINYWEGNQFHRMPIGLRFEDPIVINMLVPQDDTLVSSLATYTSQLFSQPNGGPLFGAFNSTFFSYTRQGGKGIPIIITAETLQDQPSKTYAYYNCFLEKILPIKFDASNPQPQYITMSFVVGYME